jgi:DNA-binding transcriptional LysR family regulator
MKQHRGAAASLIAPRASAHRSLARLHVIPRLPIFLAENPGLDIDVVVDDGDIDLVEAGINGALRIGDLADSTVTARKIAGCRRSARPLTSKETGVPQALRSWARIKPSSASRDQAARCDVPAGTSASLRHSERPPSRHRGGGCSRGDACKPGAYELVRVDVHPGA